MTVCMESGLQDSNYRGFLTAFAHVSPSAHRNEMGDFTFTNCNMHEAAGSQCISVRRIGRRRVVEHIQVIAAREMFLADHESKWEERRNNYISSIFLY